MKRSLIFCCLMFALQISFAQKTSLTEQFTQSLPLQANDKIICSEQQGNLIIAASLKPSKTVAIFPEQRAGSIKLFGIDYQASNTVKWTYDIVGNAYPADVQITFQGNYLLCGSFVDSIAFGNTKYFAPAGEIRAFVFLFNGIGQLQWFKTYPTAFNHMITSMTQKAGTNDTYVTCLMNDIYSEVWKININNGDTLNTKRFNEIRTISSIEEMGGNFYIAGTSGDLSMIDTITLINSLNTGYVAYMAKLNSNLKATWAVSRPYLTFDFSSHVSVQPSGSMIIWGKYEFASANNLRQSFDIYDAAGNAKKSYRFIPVGVLNEYNTRLFAPSIYPGRFNFARRVNTSLFLYTIDPVRAYDSVRIFRNSEFQLYDMSGNSSLNLLGTFTSDSLRTSKNSLVNPFKNSNGSQNSITYFTEPFVGLEKEQAFDFVLYPNPTNEVIAWQSDTEWEQAKVYDLSGRLHELPLMEEAKLSVESLAPGMYILELRNEQKVARRSFIKK